MNSATEARLRKFIERCRLDARDAARTALDRLIGFSERHPGILALDDRDLEQTSMGYRFSARDDAFLWKAYAKDEKIEIMTRWPLTLPDDKHAAFQARWKELAGRDLPKTGAGKTPMLSFSAFSNDKISTKIDALLEWLCAIQGEAMETTPS